MRIGIDLSGGDHGAREVAKGAALASIENKDLEVVLFACQKAMEDIEDIDLGGINHIHYVILPSFELEDAILWLERGKIDALVTGTKSPRLAAKVRKHLIEGVKKPGLIVPIPTNSGLRWIIDAGLTNRASDPEVFVGWAKVGRDFLQKHFGITDPRIGLANIASERAYGDLAAINQVLSDFPGYIGYAEPKLFFSGAVDLLLAEGFVGNWSLKIAEEIFGLSIGLCHKVLLEQYPDAAAKLPELIQQAISYDGEVSPLLGLQWWIFRFHGGYDFQQIACSLRAAMKYPITNSLV